MTKAENFDVVIIGSGPGGYVCAIRCAQLGFSVACVEMNPTLGGTCLNIGCIPSKALLNASHLFHQCEHQFSDLGIEAKPKLNLSQMMAHKLKIVDDLTKGIGFLFKKNKVTSISGKAEFLDKDTITITKGDDKGRSFTAKHFIIASGSLSADLPSVKVDEKDIVSSTGALSFDKVPEHLVVIGAGVIGLELGSVWQRLGAKVSVIEFLDRITPNLDGDTSKQFMRILQKQGFDFHLSHKVMGVKKDKGKLTVTAETKAGEQVQFTCDKVLSAVGRKPNTSELNLEKGGIEIDAKGFIKTDSHLCTSNGKVYAIGDCITGAMLAHKAEEEGVFVAETLVGQSPHIDYGLVPGVIYTHPEVAHVGYGEEELQAEGIEYRVGKFAMSANSRARANSDFLGLVKILSCSETDRVLGAFIIAAPAGEMIQEVVNLMEFGGSAEDLARICHAHPTFSEAVKEAALAVDKRAIHS